MGKKVLKKESLERYPINPVHIDYKELEKQARDRVKRYEGTKDLVVVDEYYAKIGQWLCDQGSDFSREVERYCLIMDKVVEDGFMGGKTSEALKEFIAQVRMDLDGDTNLETDGSAAYRYTENFITKIDDADDDLY